jgi:hypothetical protein
MGGDAAPAHTRVLRPGAETSPPGNEPGSTRWLHRHEDLGNPALLYVTTGATVFTVTGFMGLILRDKGGPPCGPVVGKERPAAHRQEAVRAR